MSAGLIAPAPVHHADDDEPAVEDRRGDAPAIPSHAAELLSQLPLPDFLAVLVEAEEEPAGRVRVDVLGRRVGR